MSNVVTGVVAFSNLMEHDFYQGKDTGNFTLTIVLDEESAAKLEAQGVTLKLYEGKKQRKFKSQYSVEVLDLENKPYVGEIPFGSTVRVLYSTGKEHQQYGVPVYMQKIRLVELSAGSETPSEF